MPPTPVCWPLLVVGVDGGRRGQKLCFTCGFSVSAFDFVFCFFSFLFWFCFPFPVVFVFVLCLDVVEASLCTA